LEPFILLLSPRSADGILSKSVSARLIDTTNGRNAGRCLCWKVEAAKPSGGFKGEALAQLGSGDCPGGPQRAISDRAAPQFCAAQQRIIAGSASATIARIAEFNA
jgi:hypothetical protein